MGSIVSRRGAAGGKAGRAAPALARRLRAWRRSGAPRRAWCALMSLVMVASQLLSSLALAPATAYALDHGSSAYITRDGWVPYGGDATFGSSIFRCKDDSSGEIGYAYCADPNRAYGRGFGVSLPTQDLDAPFPTTPDGEHPNTHELAEVRAALWFGYGGPGYDRAMWPDEDWDGTELTDGEIYAYTHVIVSDFMWGDGGYALGTYTAPAFRNWAYGTILGWDGEEFDWDSVQGRMSANKDEVPGADEFYVWLSPHATLQNLIGWYYEPKSVIEGSVEVRKSASDGADPSVLAGATYGVYSDERLWLVDGSWKVDIVIGSDGTGYYDGLEAGTYWVKEIKAPDGYELDEETYEVKVAAGCTAIVESEDTKGGPGKVRLTKLIQDGSSKLSKDATQEFVAEHGQYSVKNAQYGVYGSYADGTLSGKVATIKTNASGVGTASLEPGTYWVKETKASAGCELDDTVYPVTVETDEVSEITSYEEIRRSYIKLRKYSSGPADADASSYYSRGGATYGVYETSDCALGTEVDTIVTDASGAGQSKELLAGTYWVKEIGPAKGHGLDEVKHKVKTSPGATVTVKSTDPQRTIKISIEKSSKATFDVSANDRYSLEGAVYRVYSDEDCKKAHLVAEVTTDKDGHAEVDGLAAGTYWVKEHAPSAGHELDETVHKVDAKSPGAEYSAKSSETPVYSWIDIAKASANPTMTAGNGMYDLAGAVYGIYDTKAKAEAHAEGTEVQRLVLESDGKGGSYAKSGQLESKVYWVREISAPEGYEEDTKVYEVDAPLGETAHVSVSETPVYEPDQALLLKVDADGNPVSHLGAEGDATLEGAEFEVRYYDGTYRKASSLPAKATRTWTFRSDADGCIRYDEAHKVSGDDLYTHGGKPVLPLGTVAIREIKAPEGYWLEGQSADDASYVAPTHLMVVTQDGDEAKVERIGWDAALTVGSQLSYEARAQAEPVKRGGISIEKLDAETKAGVPQAGASYAGIQFAIINRSEHAVVSKGVAYEPGKEVENLRLVTDEAGKAATAADALPYGSYEVVEVATNGTYLLDSTAQSITIGDGQANVVTPLEKAFENHVVRSGEIEVGKSDMENLHHAPQGGATFEGIVLGIRLCELDSEGKAQHDALVDGAMFQPGQTVRTITLDHEGNGSVPEGTLPYGTYELYEVSVPKAAGYELNREWTRRFDVHEHHVAIDLSAEADADPEAATDLVYRGDLAGVKADEASQVRWEGIPFVIESLTTGEWHVVVTDPNGQFDTSASWATHDKAAAEHAANASDAAVTQVSGGPGAQGAYELTDPSALDWEAGVWFSGRTEERNLIAGDDGRGALPYDDYRLVELRVTKEQAEITVGDDNEETKLVDILFTIYRRGATVDLGTIDDQPLPAISTELTYDGGLRSAPAGGTVRLTDEVAWQNLEAGTTYGLSGELHLVGEDGKDAGVVAKASREFRAGLSSGSTTLDFELDASELAGRSVVAFETVTLGGETVATHADISDEGQTVAFPDIATTLTGDEGAHEVYAAEEVELTDVVTYRNLVPNESYELIGTLMDKETGEPVVGADGAAITARSTIVPEQPDGTETVTFKFAGSLVVGRTVVAFEDLEQQGRKLAVHADLEDRDQTVTFPKVGTTLAEGESGEHDAAAGQVTLVDVVAYENVVPGTTYQVVGTLMDKETGEPVTDADGAAVTASAPLEATEPSGTVEVEFSFDASALAGRAVVAFEELRVSGRVVADHADIEDEGQTVTFPDIRTTLDDAAAAGTHEGMAAESVTLVDTVLYEGLVPGKEYKVVGTLMDKETGEAVMGANGEAVTRSQTFVAEQASGSVDVTFEFDASLLASKTVVAYERLERDGRELAVHADIEDADQSWAFPRIGTTLADSEGSHEAPSTAAVTLTDVVAYENLVPGATYVLSAELVAHPAGAALLGDGEAKAWDAEEVIATREVEFEAGAASGTAEVAFEVDAAQLVGKTIVAYERLGRDGRMVAEHADPTDEGQTVTFPAIATTLVDSEGGGHAAVPAEGVTLIDTVAYENLVPGREYQLTGTLMDKETGRAVLNDDGTPVAVTVPLVPESANGSTEVQFSFDARGCGGRTLVAYEELAYEGRELAVHADIDDEAQSVSFPKPKIATTLSDAEDGSKSVLPAKSVKLVDTVRYEGLVPGRTYLLSGSVVYKDSGEPVKGADGEAVALERTVVPKEASGEVEMAFEIDASELSGRELVCLERLSVPGADGSKRIIASHADLSDEGQTVRVSEPAIGTTLAGTHGEHVTPATGKLALTDEVSYAGLVAGREYQLVGTLMDKATGEPVKDADGKAVTKTATFEAERSGGTAKVTFALDAIALQGHGVVAYEELWRGDDLLAEHKDISDEGQTVHVIEPEVKTVLGDADGGGHDAEPSQEMRLTDSVNYSGLAGRTEYALKGELMDKATGKAVTGADGKPVTAEGTFETGPAKPGEGASGVATVTFELDASQLAGHELVAFETVELGGKAVAEHKNLADKGQTVRVTKPGIGTELTDKATGGHSASASAGTVTLVDTVSYEGLVPGRTYELTGTLMDKATGKALQGADGKPVAKEATFEAKKSSGVATVEFEVDASLLAGKSVVAFETLSRSGRELAVHADLEDEAQTVTFPRIGTTLTDKSLGGHESKPGSTVTLVDTVSYEGLVPGKEYVVTGTLHRRETKDGQATDAGVITSAKAASSTGGAAASSQSQQAQASSATAAATSDEAKAPAASASSSAATGTSGRSVEELREASKGNGKDAYEARKELEAIESASSAGSASASSAQGQQPAQAASQAPSTARGSQATSQPAQAQAASEAKPVTGTATFVAEEASGTQAVEFSFDASALDGATAVAFEELSCEGALVAEHKDIADDAQAVTFKADATRATPSTPLEALASTGSGLLAATLAGLGAVTAAAGAVLVRRRRQGQPERDEDAPEDAGEAEQ